MALSERELEENEAKLDNVLHKISNAANKIQRLNRDLRESKDLEIIYERSTCIKILTDTIVTLTKLASEINFVDENITNELEIELGNELNIAIENIKKAKKILE